MEFRIKVEMPVSQPEIDHSSPIILWGSCFAENIGTLLQAGKFQCDINPYGILYNPFSIARALREVIAGKRYTEADLLHHNNLWMSLMHHSVFSSPQQEEVIHRINTRLIQAEEELKSARWMIFTWGTARVYEWQETGEIVGNCHKLPDRLFHRRLLEVDEIVSVYTSLLSKIREINPNIHFLFTVSPIRHIKDGMHGNQLNKATLLLAINKLCEQYAHCHYFPSYEIMMDELRDYRFYADDMLHPSSIAIQYIWKCFADTYFSEQTHHLLKHWEEIKKGIEHRPFNPESESYHRFLSQILLKIEQLKEKFPYLDVQNEIDICQARLKKSLPYWEPKE